ncbi:SPL family radical SAM protein [Sphingomonas xinjiangensis]|uniref:Spore photoproduct lyase n=1 Tax=Sphingomonas xinjiangensis TaxID=643568 RepID=A0A840YQX0_9SPHN|nr:radical SAM protein [Sphingomonas xinjiangensis]MBB5710963.1 spore photoproduct lyase [Sphingomonas xinjiangensis]
MLDVPASRAVTWRPRRVVATRSALALPHGRAILERAAGQGIDVVELPSDRITLAYSEDPKRAYAEAKATLAVVVAPPSKRRLQPIAPSADWRVDLAEGCPAHCSYCYLAGSLKGPPITRVYANIEEILDGLPAYLGQGTVTSRSATRAHEGTTFEASCYTDPLALEPLTGSLSTAIAWFGQWDAEVQLRFTTKFASVDPLLGLAHGGRTRMRASVNPSAFARFEGGTARVSERLSALRRMALAGYPVGLTIAPIIAASGWQDAYGTLIEDAGAALGDLAGIDLTVELITHRFTAGSKAVLDSWYPGSSLDMTGENRSTKRTKFGTEKQVYDADTMRALRPFFQDRLSAALPAARILYWT